jgi:hypothetical protein
MALPPREPYGSPFVSLTGRANVAAGGLFIISAILAVSTGLSAYMLVLVDRLEAGEHVSDSHLEAVDALAGHLGLAYWAALALAAIGFIVWFRRAYLNLPAFGPVMADHRPSAPIVCWFIPFVNLVMPYKVASDIWVGSEREPERRDPTAGSGILKWWWAFWIGSGVLGTIVLRGAEPTTVEGFRSQQEWLMVVNVLRILAAVLAIRVIRRLTARQHAAMPVTAHIVSENR